MDLEEIKNELISKNINEIIAEDILNKLNKNKIDQDNTEKDNEIIKLKSDIGNEDNYLIKAKLAAKIISLNIDT